jgi:hypothetical protein
MSDYKLKIQNILLVQIFLLVGISAAQDKEEESQCKQRSECIKKCPDTYWQNIKYRFPGDPNLDDKYKFTLIRDCEETCKMKFYCDGSLKS